jgi:hypothetical protein
MTTCPWFSLATNQIWRKTEQSPGQEHLQHRESGIRRISRPVHEEEPMWTRRLLTCAGRSFGKTQMNGDMSPKTQEPVGPQEEVAEEETGTDDNDIGRNAPFFETRYPMTSNWWRLRLLDQAVPFLDLGPLDDSKRYICNIEALEGPYKRQLILHTLHINAIAVATTAPEVSVTDLTARNSIVVIPSSTSICGKANRASDDSEAGARRNNLAQITRLHNTANRQTKLSGFITDAQLLRRTHCPITPLGLIASTNRTF